MSSSSWRSGDQSTGAFGPVASHGRLRGAQAFRLHLTLVVGLTICTLAFAFEISRALGGNTLSWAYVFEWPIFAAFAVYMWWNLLHDAEGSGPHSARSSERFSGTSPADGGAELIVESRTAGQAGEDADLKAWQEYLRAMEAEEAEEARLSEDPTRR